MRHWLLPAGIVAGTFLLPCLTGGVTAIAEDASAQRTPLKSAKERLSDKASDEQRVNNCRVPLDRRGSKPRPDCPPDQAKEAPASDTTATPR